MGKTVELEQPLLFGGVVEEKLKPRSPARAFLEASREHGGLVSQSMVADSLGVSSARVSELVELGRFGDLVTINGRRYIRGDALEFFLAEERKHGVRRDWLFRAKK